MAIVEFTDGHKETVRAEIAEQLWFVLNGEIEATAEQAALCETIAHVWLNRHKAPESYRQHHAYILSQMDI